MPSYAVLNSSAEVINIIEAENQQHAVEHTGEQCVSASFECKVGDVWDEESKTFISPTEEVEPYEIPEEDLPEDVKMARLYPEVPEGFIPPVLPNP